MLRWLVRSRVFVGLTLALCLASAPIPARASEGVASPPNDPRWSEQWAFENTPGIGLSLLEGWTYATGAGAVVAVLDTGLVSHPEFLGRVLPGYDFISNPSNAGDGDGRDADATDPGDWVSEEDIAAGSLGSGCEAESSSWHGTHVAGIIAAAADNGIGVAGIAPAASILPVRVIGKCGGSQADLIDGIRWAAGLEVIGVPLNPNPAAIINISLGSMRSCSPELQATVDLVSARDIIIVSSVGNDNTDASLFSPANCLGTLTVSALSRDGQRAHYSNFGSAVDLAAPGGDRSGGILSTVDSGTTNALGADYRELIGTSMAAPMVSGVLALARSVDPSTSRTDLLTLLLQNLAPFVQGVPPYDCASGNACGLGSISAPLLLRALETRIAPEVKSLIAPGMRIGTKQTVQILINGKPAEYSLQGSTVCALKDGILTALREGTCALIYRQPGSTSMQNVNVNQVVRVVKTKVPRVSLKGPTTLQVGDRTALTVSTIAGGKRRYTSLTTGTCRVSSSGNVRGVRAGRCTIQLRIAAAHGFVTRTKSISFMVSSAP
jgi:subtilisin family serine protease